MAVDGSTTDRTNNLDILRLVAASQVMVEHSFGYLQIPRFTGWPILAAIEGVPIFFVISGFLISASWQGNPSASQYAVRRASRIFPGLWVCLAATLAVAGAFGFVGPPRQSVTWFAAQMAGLIYTPAYLTSFGVGAYNTSLWTIPIELQFYVALPVAMWSAAKLKLGRTALTGCFVAFLFLAIGLYWSWLPPLGAPETGIQKLVRYSFVPHFYMFMAGVVIREYKLHRTKMLAGSGCWWVLGYAAYLAIVPHDPLHHPFAAICARLILAVTAISVAYTIPTLAKRLLRDVDVSYGIYIYHGLAINALLELGYLHDIRGAFVVIAVTPVLAAASWFGVERPILRLAHRFNPRNASPAIKPLAIHASAN